MNVFVRAIVSPASEERSQHDRPMPSEPTRDEKWNLAKRDQDGAIPPGHRDRVLVLFIEQMVGMICFESLMVNHRMRLKGVIKLAKGPVHEKPMQRPLKKG